MQDPPHQGEETEGEGEVWSEPASPYSAPYPGPLTPPHPLYPPTFGMGPWPPAQMVCSACAGQWAVVVTAAPPVPCASEGAFLAHSLPVLL